MGAEIAVHGANPASVSLHNFTDTILVKLELEAGCWVIIGRALLHNADGDFQYATASIIHDANVVLDRVTPFAPKGSRHCLAVQATLRSERSETVVLSCNTYNGFAEFGSLIAIKVDTIVP